MRRLLIAFALAASLCAGAAADDSHPPLSKNDILGRLASGSSPSYVAHLVKMRGISFTADDDFLKYVKDAGGEGVLLDSIGAATSGDEDDAAANNNKLLAHMAKCAFLQQSGETSKAAKECKAAADANPKDPFALLAEAHCAVDGASSEDQPALARQAAALDPQLAEAHLAVARFSADYDEQYSEFSKAIQLEPEELDAIMDFLNVPPQETVGPGGGGIFVTLEPNATPYGDTGVTDTVEPDDTSELSSPDTEAALLPPPPPPAATASQESWMVAPPPEHELGPEYPRGVRATIDALQKILDREPDYAPAHTSMADLLLMEGKDSEAIDEIRKALQVQPGDASMHIMLANALEIRGGGSLDVKNMAADEWRTALAIKPSDPSVHEGLAVALDSVGDEEGAIEQYQECLELTPASEDCHAGIANEYNKIGRVDDEIAEYRRYLSQVSGQMSIFERLDFAQVLAGANHLSDAAAECEQAIATSRETPEAHYELAKIRYWQRYLPDAVYEYREAVRLAEPQGGDPRYTAGLAFVLGEDGKPDEALATYKDALKQWPDEAEVHNDLAWFYATYSDKKYRDLAQALVEARKGVELSGWKEAGLVDTLAEAEFQNRQFDAAIATETKALALDPTNVQIQHQLERFKNRDVAVPPAAQ